MHFHNPALFHILEIILWIYNWDSIWHHHGMKMLSTLLASSPVTGWFSSQRPEFWFFFVPSLKGLLNKLFNYMNPGYFTLAATDLKL